MNPARDGSHSMGIDRGADDLPSRSPIEVFAVCVSSGMECRPQRSCPAPSLLLPFRIPCKAPDRKQQHNVRQMPLQRGSGSTSAPAAHARRQWRKVARPFRFRDLDNVLAYDLTMHR